MREATATGQLVYTLLLKTDVDVLDLQASKSNLNFETSPELPETSPELPSKAINDKLKEKLRFDFEVFESSKVQTIDFFPRAKAPFGLTYNIPMQLMVVKLDLDPRF